jgi:DNA repair protein RadA/Sms
VARSRTVYRCSECGADHAKWAGKCDACGEWNTLVEEIAAPKVATKRGKPGVGGFGAGGRVVETPRVGDVSGSEATRIKTGIDEFDFVLGGGIVPGSLVLVGGEPGIGKSTMLLQVAAELEARGHAALYVSGEESPLQVKLRADRLAPSAQRVALLGETLLETVLATAEANPPSVMVVDSIQTIFTGELEGAPGNVGQVRECAARLMRFAKERGVAVLLIGHVTKGGGIAGPKTLEHIVDTVLYFEGESSLDHRVLRATKNRFGSVDEIGVFRMTEGGLIPVANPSELFLANRGAAPASGSAVTALIEGTRPVLVEVQALAAKSGFGTPQRVANGFDSRRLAMILAVLERRAGLSCSALDVFLNVVGGARLQEPAGDLAIAAALASSISNKPLGPYSVFIGEVGLGGEVRPVSQVERRLVEAEKMGMRTAYIARRAIPNRIPEGLNVRGVDTVNDAFEAIAS